MSNQVTTTMPAVIVTVNTREGVSEVHAAEEVSAPLKDKAQKTYKAKKIDPSAAEARMYQTMEGDTCQSAVNTGRRISHALIAASIAKARAKAQAKRS